VSYAAEGHASRRWLHHGDAHTVREILLSPDSPLLAASDRLGSGNLAPLVVVINGRRQINPVLAQNHIQVIAETHGKTSQLSASDVDALATYLLSLE
jgi:hypothetical protein